MCGIAGLIYMGNGSLNPEMIVQMTEPISHRGPDDEGFLAITLQGQKLMATPYGGKSTPDYIYAATHPYAPRAQIHRSFAIRSEESLSILLGHRRLSILDLTSAGHQPMCNRQQSLWITYNGEIFNYLDIRQQLEQYGYTFHSNTDTEVILYAYDHWGVNCLHHFNGMFAFLIVDLKRNTFFAARDRFGVKPLYFWHSPCGYLAFASEIKQFVSLPGWTAKAHLPLAVEYLLHGVTDFSSATLFEGVLQLRGGQYIECSIPLVHSPEVQQWYSLRKKPSSIPWETTLQQCRHLFQDAVRLRLRADVDIGSCLSGGLDSSAIVCMANHLLSDALERGKQKTFSANSHVARFDESHYINEVAAHTGVDSYFVTPNVDELFKTIKHLVWHQDEPFGSSSIFAQYLVFALAKQAGVKVMLDGQGADECLAGYSSFWHAHFANLAKTWNFWTLYHEMTHAKESRSVAHFSPIEIFKYCIPPRYKRALKNVFHACTSRLSNHWIDSSLLSKNALSVCDPVCPNDLSHSVDHLSYEQMMYTSLPALLRYEDRNSMAHSIEARTPFLDYRLVEFFFNLPADFKIGNGYTKRVLRGALKDILPEKIRCRTDKLGFATAEEVWIYKERPHQFKQALQEAIDKSRGLLTQQAMTLADDIIQNRLPFSWVLWRMINFGYWIETFDVTL